MAEKHTLGFAVVTAIGKEPAHGNKGDDYEPLYAVDIQMLDEHGEQKTDSPIYEAVPLPTFSAGSYRGFYGFPPIGSRVVVAFAYESPANPVILATLPHGKELHALPTDDLVIAATEKTYQRAKIQGDEQWRIVAGHGVYLGTENIDLVKQVRELSAQVEKLSAILSTHTHPESIGSSTGAPSQAGAINAVKSASGTIKSNVQSIET